MPKNSAAASKSSKPAEPLPPSGCDAAEAAIEVSIKAYLCGKVGKVHGAAWQSGEGPVGSAAGSGGWC